MSTQVEEVARAALPLYGFTGAAELDLLNVSENTTYLVRDGAGREAVLRVHRTGYHTKEAIESELAWMAALRAEAGVRTTEPIAALDGERVVTGTAGTETRHCVMFRRLPGAAPEEGDGLVGRFAELGELTARLHRHARGWRRPPGFSRFSWDFDTTLGARPRWGPWTDGLGVGPAERAVLGRLAEVIGARLAAYGRGPERWGLVHADLRLANLLVDGADTYVIDFDDCGFGWYLYDLATALSFIEHNPLVPDMIDAWLRGYTREHPLSAAERAEIPTFVMLRRLLLVAWIGSHSTVPEARALGSEFTKVSCDLAETYLTDHPHPHP